jgi:uncharacterized protein (TIGR03000 family)
MIKPRCGAGTAVVLAVLGFFGRPDPVAGQGYAYYGGSRGSLYGGGYLGGSYGTGYFGVYRGGYAGGVYGLSPYGAGVYGNPAGGVAYLGLSPYLGGYGLNAPYAHAYPYAPYASAFRPFTGLPEYGSSLTSPTVPRLRIRDLRTTTPTGDDKGHVVVKLPRANAELLIDGNKTEQKGKSRRFVSAAIAEGRTRTYQLTARWREKGTEVERTRKITLRAGQHRVIQFTAAPRKKKRSE